ncbi:hypothetical protein AAG570_014176 [Ranatra chinensis]|uniref:Protein kinase domain-containing protein n=1 Tax=Ranatra chinensis TaxID=642074 RepID=A0ABD0XS65_9HEMI
MTLSTTAISVMAITSPRAGKGLAGGFSRFFIIKKSFEGGAEYEIYVLFSKSQADPENDRAGEVGMNDDGKIIPRNDSSFPDTDGIVSEEKKRARATGAFPYVVTAPAVGSRISTDNAYVLMQKGTTLLGVYQIEQAAIPGGMGKVWKVRHKGWDVALALKQPRAELFQTAQQKTDFIHECEAWMHLGLHPHIVSCYYIREIQGIPTIFSEWMEGGSLRQWIALDDGTPGRLYDGPSDVVLERILDIAIQFCRGLHYAHTCDESQAAQIYLFSDQNSSFGKPTRLIHQDVKPDNLLLTPDGEAKVADFGVSRAQTLLLQGQQEAAQSFLPNTTIVSSSGVYTLAYCSPEQAAGETLSRRTDIYSWALSVLEMFLGKRYWKIGAIVGRVCEEYFSKDMPVSLPESMKDLLRLCLEEIPALRPHDFFEVEIQLLKIYYEITGKEYSRTPFEPVIDTADSLNNKALSFLDLGKLNDVEHCWEKALRFAPEHRQSLYNQSLYKWRCGFITDQEALCRIKDSAIPERNSDLALLHLERAAPHLALECLIQMDPEHTDMEETTEIARSAVRMQLRGEYFSFLHTVAQADGEIMRVFLSCDDRFVLFNTTTCPNTVRLYDVQTGNELQSFTCNAHYTLAMCQSPDNSMVAAGENSDIGLWDADTGKRLFTLRGHQDEINGLSFSKDGTRLLSCSCDKTAAIWDIRQQKIIQRFQGHQSYVSAVCFSPDESKVVTGSSDHTVRLWDVQSGTCLNIYGGNIHHLRSMMQGSTETRYNIQRFDGYDEQTHATDCFAGHTKHIKSVSISRDNRRILSEGADWAVKLWDAASAVRLQNILTGLGDMSSACFDDASERVFIFSGERSQTALWDAAAGRCLHTIGDSRLEGTLFLPFADRQRWLFRSMYNNALSVLRIPTFSFHSPYALCRVATVKNVDHLEKQFRFRVRDIESDLKSDDISLALHKANRLREMPTWGASCEALRVRRLVGRYCVKTALAKSTPVKLGSWPMSRYAEVREFAYTPARYIIASIYKYVPPAYGINHRVILLQDARTGKEITTIPLTEPEQSGILGLMFNAKGTCLLIHSRWGCRVCSTSTGKEESAIPLQISFGDLSSHPDYRGFTSQQATNIVLAEKTVTLSTVKGEDACISIVDAALGQRLFSIVYGEKHPMAAWFSKDGNRVEAIYYPSSKSDIVCEYVVHELDWEYIFPGFTDWDEGALPFLRQFLAGYPAYTEEDFDVLMTDLQIHGYGHLRPEGVRNMLNKLQ